ncbi:hypothetical protein O6H91_04G071900 [Diphasiastrum complanatum]|uniref:Uncharacterized protein n=3 Tax=Diphasiastrum complanatum TaxID=34168 RepID=A0ACC2DY41_DIPCM|nr:hypothetical protein O6H91_04G071900 [Diphasiastrum complanatum]KAJ7559134.1 hypothetical protein O6H91_04G071900 [Diphasiastrum complanatum]KAJ7559136.1 hypothetical protein O6H91_04G071900 [Diphasiastrum complanatum]
MGRRNHFKVQNLPMLSLRHNGILQQLQDLLRLVKTDKRLATIASWIGAGAAVAIIVMKWLPPPVFKDFLVGADKEGASIVKRQRGSSDLEHEMLTVPGLKNAGSNCFLNVVLQALASCDVLVEFLCTCANKSILNKLEDVNDEQFDMPLATTVAYLLTELCELGPAHCTLSPRPVMLALDSYAKNFDLALQQDAVEALAHLATALQEERVEFFERCRPTLHSFSFDSIEECSSKSCLFLKMHMVDKEILHSWTRQLRWPLEGAFGSSLECQLCNFQFSVHFQVFNEVPLLPQWDQEGVIIHECSLEDCLTRFIAPSRVSDVICSRCSHLDAMRHLAYGSFADMGMIRVVANCVFDEQCSCEALILEHGGVWNTKKTDAYQRLRIGRVPEVLCLQIQRAVVMDSGQVQKLMGHVSFPMILDLSPYTITAQHPITRAEAKCEKPCYRSMLQPNDSKELPRKEKHQPARESQLPSKHEAKQENNWKLCDRIANKEVLFELLAVIVHLGGPQEGHYMVYRKVKVPKGKTESPAFDSSKNCTSSVKMEQRLDEMEIDQCILITPRSTLDVVMDDYIKESFNVDFQPTTNLNFKASQSTENGHDNASQYTRESCETEDSLWFLISDAIVKKVTEQEVLAADASLLLFGRLTSTFSGKQ